MKKCFVFVLFSGVLFSCLRDDVTDGPADPDASICAFTVSVDKPVTGSDATRSSFAEVDPDRITDLNVFIYHDGTLLSDCCRYYEDMSSLMLAFPTDMDGFNIYMLGNVGKVEPPVDEDGLPALQCVIPSYGQFLEKGFPLAEAFPGYRKGDPAHFRLKRLVGQYDVRMKVSAADARYSVKDVRLKNCSRDVYPFSTETPSRIFYCTCDPSDCRCGDYLTEEDVARLNAGETVALYFMENLQGVLLPDNTDSKLKIPSSLDLIDSGVADMCTYIEVTADVTTQMSRYEDGKYRFYLGQDQTTDFSIRRNTLYSVVLDFTQNMVCEEEWRIEADSPEVVPVKMDKDVAMVIKGAEDMVYVQAFDNDGNLMDFDVEVLSSNGYINVEKVLTDYREQASLGKAMGLKFTSNVSLEGLYPYLVEPTYLTETVRVSSRETYNGEPVFSKDIKVRVYNKLFPLLIKVEYGPDKYGKNVYNVILRGRNPMGLGLSLEYFSTTTLSAVSASRGTAFNKYTGTGEIQENAVNMQGIQIVSLPSGVTSPDDLSRIDFTVSAIVYSESLPYLAYPRLQNSGPVFMGQDTEATVGPGKDMVPGSMTGLPEDGMFWVQVHDHDKAIIGDSHVTHCGPKLDSYAKKFSWQSNSMEVTLFYGSGSTAPVFRMGRCDGVDKQAYQGLKKHEQSPFYFVNGGMTVSDCNVNMNCSSVKYPNYSTSTLQCIYYAPGRDLFMEKKGDQAYCIHTSKYSVRYWKNLLNKDKSLQTGKSYDGKFYMTINGASSWVGADTSSYGYFAAGY